MNRAVLHGQQYEATARKMFEMMYDVKVSAAGLFVSVDRPWLGASPDGVIDSDRIIEIKCPYRGRKAMIEPSPMFPFLVREGPEIKLKQHSKYFCQIQGQLYVTGRRICKFVVYTLVDVLVQEIELDVNYCKESLLPKLDLFYERYFRKYIAKSLQ